MSKPERAGVAGAGTPAFMTQKDYAARHGVGAPAVSNWRKSGLLVFGSDPATARLVDVAASDAKVAAHRDPLRGRPTKAVQDAAKAAPAAASAPVTMPNEFQAARTKDMQARADRGMLELRRMAGDLAPLAELTRRASAIGPMVFERVRSSVRSRLEEMLRVGELRPASVILDECLDKAFAEIADQIESGFLAETDQDPVPESLKAEIAEADRQGDHVSG